MTVLAVAVIGLFSELKLEFVFFHLSFKHSLNDKWKGHHLQVICGKQEYRDLQEVF